MYYCQYNILCYFLNKISRNNDNDTFNIHKYIYIHINIYKLCMYIYINYIYIYVYINYVYHSIEHLNYRNLQKSLISIQIFFLSNIDNSIVINH